MQILTPCHRRGLRHQVLFLIVALGASALIINAHAASVSQTPTPKQLGDFEKLAREETWVEKRLNASGQIEAVNVTDKIWTQAMQATLDSKGSLYIPARQQPYYLDAPLVLRSGQKIVADRDAEIRLKPGSNTCLVRNAGVVSFRDHPVPSETNPDTDISIEGGIWSTLAVSKSESNGNTRGHSSKENYAFGTHGVILLQNVRRVRVANVTVRQSRPFAVHLSNVQNFEVEDIHLDDHMRDGVHVNGPASDGLIRNVDGVSHDDTVALNAWDWKNYAPSYGPIERVVIEDIRGGPAGVPSANAIRLLPGIKKFDDGTQLDCHLSDVTIRRVTDIDYFKIYDQPNLELGRQTDFSAGVGSVNNLCFESLVFTRPSRIELHANTNGISIRDVRLMHPTPPDWRLLFIGPKSQTYKTPNPERWTEIFSPDLDCTVRGVAIAEVRPAGSSTDMPVERVVTVVKQQLNLDYPRTTPKGGTGKGIWIR